MKENFSMEANLVERANNWGHRLLVGIKGEKNEVQKKVIKKILGRNEEEE